MAQDKPNLDETSFRIIHKLGFEERCKLVEALLECNCMVDDQRRNRVVNDLRAEISRNIERDPARQIDVDSIVRTCLDYPGGIEDLLEIVQYWESGSIAVQRLIEVTLEVLSPNPISEPLEGSPEQAFVVLREIMPEPEVQKAAMIFHAVFQGAREQVDVVCDYKELHDQLHQLQFEYSLIVGDTKRFPDDATTQENLNATSVRLETTVMKLREIANRPSLIQNSQLAWIQEIAQAQQELQQAIEDSNAEQLKDAIEIIRRVLARQPSRINDRLIESAKALRLPALVNAMILLYNRFRSLNLEREKISQFADGVSILTNLNSTLSGLLLEHDSWQAVDINLRMLEQSPLEDMEELILSWEDVRAQTVPLYGEWAQQFEADSEKLQQYIADGALPQAKRLFKSYCSRAYLRFFEVDKKLKEKCNEVRRVGEPLHAILEAMI